MSKFFQTSGKQILIFRRRSRQNSEFSCNLLKDLKISDMVLVFVSIFDKTTHSLSELFALHNDVISRLAFVGAFVAIRNDVSVFGNGNGCLTDVTCDHSNDDACLFAFIYGLGDSLFQWVFDACKT